MIRRCLRCNDIFVTRNNDKLCPFCIKEVGKDREVEYMDMDDFLEGMKKEDVGKIPFEVR